MKIIGAFGVTVLTTTEMELFSGFDCVLDSGFRSGPNPKNGKLWVPQFTLQDPFQVHVADLCDFVQNQRPREPGSQGLNAAEALPRMKTPVFFHLNLSKFVEINVLGRQQHCRKG